VRAFDVRCRLCCATFDLDRGARTVRLDEREGGVEVTTGSDVARAAHHATEAERLLAGRLGFLTNLIKAQVHASLAIYYATRESTNHR
jgi:hypothetical protein